MRTYDLQERTLRFADSVRAIVITIPWTFALYDDCKQVVRSSGSVAANCREADGAVSRRDFFYRIRVCRKEAQESLLWLKLLLPHLQLHQKQLQDVIGECEELIKIFSTIEKRDLQKSQT